MKNENTMKNTLEKYVGKIRWKSTKNSQNSQMMKSF